MIVVVKKYDRSQQQFDFFKQAVGLIEHLVACAQWQKRRKLAIQGLQVRSLFLPKRSNGFFE